MVAFVIKYIINIYAGGAVSEAPENRAVEHTASSKWSGI